MKIISTLILILSCSSLQTDEQGQKEIEITGIKHSYTKSEQIVFSLKNNSDKKVSAHFEGHFYTKSYLWQEFDNDLLSKEELKQESNLSLNPQSLTEFSIESQKFLKKFKSLSADSFKIRVVYYDSNDNKLNFLFSKGFTIK